MPQPSTPQPASRAGLDWRWRLFAVAIIVTAGVVAALDSVAAGDPWADSVFESVGTTNADYALGDPDDDSAQVSADGMLTIAFGNNALLDGGGTDLMLHLPGDGDADAEVFVSANGVDFVSVGTTDDDGNADFDVAGAGLDYVTHVRITNVTGDGFDLNAIEAIHLLDLYQTHVTLSPTIAEGPGFTEHTVTAHVEETFDYVGGVSVSFAVTSGPNAGVGGEAPTDGSGNASFAWIGSGGPGDDEVVAWLDLNGNGALDAETEPAADPVTQTWHGVTAEIFIIDVDGGGYVIGDLTEVLLLDMDENAYPDAKDTVMVYVESNSGSGFDLLLTETGSDTGEFIGHFDLNGEIAAVGDTVTATYIDALNGEGVENQEVEADPALEVVADEEEGLKVTICHMPPGNPGNQKTLELGGEAYRAHIAHGDKSGECGDPVEPTKQEQAAERREERRADLEAQRSERDEAFCATHDAEHPRCREESPE